MKLLAVVGVAVLAVSSASAQCIDVSKPVTLTGTLTREVSATPLNERSDTKRVTYILNLPKPVCATGDQFVDPKQAFDRVHVSAEINPTFDWLRAHVGQEVTLTSGAYGGHTTYHFAPLVMKLPRAWKAPA